MEDLQDGAFPEDFDYDAYAEDAYDEDLHSQHGDAYLFSCGTPSYDDIIKRHNKLEQEKQQQQQDVKQELPVQVDV